MQDLNVRFPSVYNSNVGPYDSSSFNLFRSQSGYTGPKVLPLRVNPYSFTFGQYSMQGREDLHGINYWYEGDFGYRHASGISFPDGLPSNTPLYNRVISKLAERTRGSLDLSVDIAQAGQVARMAKVTDRLVEFSKTAVGRFGPLKALGKAWLTYQYGIKPLLSSIYGAADESLRFALNRTKRFSVRETERFPSGRIGLINVWGSWTYFPSTLSVKRSMTVGVILDDLDFDLARWSSLNPISIAWELLPFSFVADWFVNVGGYLRDVETSLLLASRFRQGYLTELVTVEGHVELHSVTASPYEWDRHYYGDLKYLTINRSVLPTYPAPRLPTFRADLGSSRLFSAAALLSQGLSGKR